MADLPEHQLPLPGTPEPGAPLGAPGAEDEPAPVETYLGEYATREEAEAAMASAGSDLAAAQRAEADANARAEEAQRTIHTLISTPRAELSPEPAAPPTALTPPNPIEDPEGFAQWTQDTVAGVETRVRAELRRENDGLRNEGIRDRLWREFQDENPEYRGMDDIAQAAFLQATNGTGQIPADTAALKSDVKARLDAMRQRFLPGDAAVAAGGDDPAAASTATPAANRTAGVGGESRGMPIAKGDDEPTVKTFADLIGDMHDKSEFF